MFSIIYAGRHPLTTGVRRHMHKVWELIYCTSGSGSLVFDDRTLTYGANDVAIIPPRIPHSNQSDDGFTNIHVNISDLPLSYTEPVIVRADGEDLLRDAFRAVYCLYSDNTADRSYILPLYGQVIAAHLNAGQPVNYRNGVVHDIENNIMENYSDCNYDLRGYLQTLPFSTEYLTKLFKRETGMTPFQFLKNCRLENAANILGMTYGRSNITETAQLCGFNDPLYFSRQFHNKYGVSPSNYRVDKPLDGDSMKTML